MAKTNPTNNAEDNDMSSNKNYASNLTPQQKIAMSLYLAKDPIAKISAPYAGNPAIIGNDTMGYHSAYPSVYEGLKPQQMYSLMGLNSKQGTTTPTDTTSGSGSTGLSDNELQFIMKFMRDYYNGK